MILQIYFSRILNRGVRNDFRKEPVFCFREKCNGFFLKWFVTQEYPKDALFDMLKKGFVKVVTQSQFVTILKVVHWFALEITKLVSMNCNTGLEWVKNCKKTSYFSRPPLNDHFCYLQKEDPKMTVVKIKILFDSWVTIFTRFQKSVGKYSLINYLAWEEIWGNSGLYFFHKSLYFFIMWLYHCKPPLYRKNYPLLSFRKLVNIP